MRCLCSKRNRARRDTRSGFTLIEVIASLVLIGTLMVGVLMAHRRCARQTKLSKRRMAAIEVLDGMMDDWAEPEADRTLSLDGASGKAPGDNKFHWRKLVAGQLPDELLGLSIMRIEVFDPSFESGDSLAFVEIVVPVADSLGERAIR